MPLINVDLTNIPDPESLPEGQYLCRIEKIEEKTSKAGNKYLDVSYNVEEPAEYNGRKILFDNLTLTEKALWRVRDWVNAAGIFPGPDGFKTEEMIGAFLRVTLIKEPQMQNQLNQASGTTQLVPKVDSKGQQMFRNKVVGYAQR